MLATASAQVCVPLGHSSLYFSKYGTITILVPDSEVNLWVTCTTAMSCWKHLVWLLISDNVVVYHRHCHYELLMPIYVGILLFAIIIRLVRMQYVHWRRHGERGPYDGRCVPPNRQIPSWELRKFDENYTGANGVYSELLARSGFYHYTWALFARSFVALWLCILWY